MDLNRKWVVLNPKVRNVSLIDMGKSKIFILYLLEDYVIELKMHFNYKTENYSQNNIFMNLIT